MHSFQFMNKEEHAQPLVVKETAATALVDGNNLLGPVVGKFCMQLAIEKARGVGIGWVAVKRSNHFGISGHYSMMALQEGMIGMSFCNATPVLVPTRAKEGVFGTNPISVAAPAKDGDSYVLDMSTTTVAMGKVELKNRLGESLPSGWGLADDGKTSTDAATVFLKTRKLTPLGGLEESSGYKGYGLAMMVEVFCSVLSGANSSPYVRLPWAQQESCRGQCFAAIDPKVFAPGFEDRLTELIDHCRGLQPAEGEDEVLVAGDPERAHMRRCEELGGIPYHPNQMEFADKIAKEYHIPQLKRTEWAQM